MPELVQSALFEVDIDSGLVIRPLHSILAKGDKNANRIGAVLKRNGMPFDMSGATVTGKFIAPPDGIEIPLVGEASGSVVSVVLKEECYATAGHFECDIIVSAGEVRRTILKVSGDVHYEGSGAVLNVNDVIPSIDDIIEQYATMQRVTRETEEARDAAIDAAQKSPYIDASTNNWFVWDGVNGMYVDTGVRATGPQGPQGANGEGSGTVVSVTVNGQTYEADETGDVDLGMIAGGAGGGVSSVTINGAKYTPDASGDVAATVSQIRRGVVYAQPYNNTAVSEYGLQLIDNQNQKSLYLISELNTPDVLHYQVSGGSRRAVYSEGNPPPYPVVSATMNGESFAPDENGNIDFGTISGGSGGSGGTAADSEKLGGKEPKYYLQPVNLLDNGNFANPVNQLGKTTYSGKGAQAVDRWYVDGVNCEVLVNSGYVTARTTVGSAYAVLSQNVKDASKLAGKTLTFAARVYSSVIPRIQVYSNSVVLITVRGAALTDSVLVATFTVPDDVADGDLKMSIASQSEGVGDYVNIYWAALYEGSYTSTNLPPYVPKGYATELLACSIADTGRVHDSDKLGGQAPSYYENKVTSVNGATGDVTVSQIRRGVTNLQPYNNNAVTEYGLQAYNTQTGKSLYVIIRDAAPNVLRIISANTSQDVYSTLNPQVKTATVTFAFNGESLWHYAQISGVTKASQIISITSINEGFWATGLIYDNTLGILTQFRNSDDVYAYSIEAQVAYMV